MVYITGCDGSGKTTQAALLSATLATQGLSPRRLWLRFPFRFSLILLAYARLRGLSWSETHGSVRHGYWDFQSDFLMRRLFPVFLWLDAALASIRAIHWPLRHGETIICERFALDMLVDLVVATNDPSLLVGWPGRWYTRLIPRNATIVLLDADPATLRARRSDLQTDQRLEARRQAFQVLATTYNVPLISSLLPLETVQAQIYALLEATDAHTR
jgi:thymidylate kinase